MDFGPNMASNDIHYKCKVCDEITYPFQTSKRCCHEKIRIFIDTLLYMWFLIDAGIKDNKDNPC